MRFAIFWGFFLLLTSSIIKGDLTFQHAKFVDHFNSYLGSKVMSPELKKDINQLIGQQFDEVQLNCEVCKVMVTTVLSWVEGGDTPEVITEKFTALCMALLKGSEYVCRGAAERRAESALWIINQKNGTENPVTPELFCGFIHYEECWVGGEQFEWTLDLDFLGQKPVPEIPQRPSESKPKLKVLQLTDIHIDPDYVVGGNAACDDSNCCRPEQELPTEAAEQAGHWGDYRKCDTPLHSYLNLLDQIATHKDIDYVIFTGDIVAHGHWATSKNSNREVIIYALTQMRQKLSVPVFPIIGNGDAHPPEIHQEPGQTLPEYLSTAWLYDLARVMWGFWIPSSGDTIIRGGYYAYEYNARLKIIGLNSNFCYNYNWWLLYESKDVAGQLMWLAEELLKSERIGQKVHILAHIPLSTDCFAGYARQYARLIDRFENTIVAQFHGHTHQEHFNVFYDESWRPISVGLIGGSGTAFGGVNPSYRIFTVDGDYPGSTYRPLDFETWFYDLTEANLRGAEEKPNWKKLYQFSEEYQVYTMFPQDMDLLISRLVANPTLFEQYYKLKYTMSDMALEAGCDIICRKRTICEMVRTVQGDNSRCREIEPEPGPPFNLSWYLLMHGRFVKY